MIAGMTYYDIAWYFIMYSFAGWCIEVIYHALKSGKVINRGFLCGPVCPVYGFGILAVFAMTKSAIPAMLGISEGALVNGRSVSGILAVFFSGLILATAVELAAGWLLDIAFHARWWDYSAEPFNLNGYICLRFSIIWGMAAVFVVRIVQPMMENSRSFRLPAQYGWPVLAAVYAVYAFDFVVTVMIVAGLNKRLSELDDVRVHMRRLSDDLSEKIGGGTIRTQNNIEQSRVQAALAKYEARDELKRQMKELEKMRAGQQNEFSRRRKEFELHRKTREAEFRYRLMQQEKRREEKKLEFEKQKNEMEQRIAALKKRSDELRSAILSHRIAGSGRILNAFPQMKHRKHGELLKKLQDLL